ncbi:MAG: efflux RND transporter periplasmic adaptor subunit [Thiohalobacterales bacterium]|nr:efflux RND transporter periplasmic adaptor subunit [Thiohalobacterales bacterium]
MLAAAVVVLAACEKAPEPEVKEAVRPVKMMTLGGSSADATLEYPGTISAASSVELGFEVPGKIIELPLTEGQEVTAGDVLARLDPADYEAARDAADSNRRAQSAAYSRAKKIFEQGAGSQAEVDRTLRDIQVAKEELKRAQKALDDTVLKAPFSGEIARKIADNFQNVQAKEPILLLQDISGLEMDINVPEQDLALATPGLTHEERTARARPEIVISTFPDRRFPARFKSISTTADPVTRTYAVTLAFDNPADITVLPGMTAKVVLHVREAKLAEVGVGGFLVPVSAVAADEWGNAYAWRIDPDSMRVSRVPVELGPMAGDEVRVLGGLNGGDTIATAGVHQLREGMQVRPLDN